MAEAGVGVNGIKIRPVSEYFALSKGVAGIDLSCSGPIPSLPGNLRGTSKPDRRAEACS